MKSELPYLLGLVVAAGSVTLATVALPPRHAPAPPPPGPTCEAVMTDDAGKSWELAYVVKHLDEAGQRVTSLVCVYRPVRYGDATRRQRKDA